MLKILKTRTVLVGVVATAMLVGSAGRALAGPPLICHPFETGAAALLPWGSGPGWNTPSPAYDLRQLTPETLRVLTPAAPVLARMENLRRATIYAMRDPAVAHTLIEAVVDRALSAERGVTSEAWFDAAYIVEAYRQAVFLRAKSISAASWAATDAMLKVDGYGFMKKALLIAKSSPEIEYAASLMTEGAVSSAHRERALAAAPRGSLLARNLSQ